MSFALRVSFGLGLIFALRASLTLRMSFGLRPSFVVSLAAINDAKQMTINDSEAK
jgi:hypothetical protein